MALKFSLLDSSDHMHFHNFHFHPSTNPTSIPTTSPVSTTISNQTTSQHQPSHPPLPPSSLPLHPSRRRTHRARISRGAGDRRLPITFLHMITINVKFPSILRELNSPAHSPHTPSQVHTRHTRTPPCSSPSRSKRNTRRSARRTRTPASGPRWWCSG